MSSSNNRSEGTVKWFSNQKGYGFVTVKESGEDIFVHQTEVDCGDAYRTLNQGWIVEFDIVEDENGKKKAVNVTSVGGGPCTGPRVARRQQRRRSRQVSSKNLAWHAILNQQVKDTLRSKSIRTKTGTVDVALNDYRIKLGTAGYASMAHGDGILAEGTFTCDEDGSVSLTWERALQFDGDEWTSRETEDLVSSLSLMDDAVEKVNVDETPESLWGDDKSDPRDSLESHGFQMRQVVLTRKPRGREEQQQQQQEE